MDPNSAGIGSSERDDSSKGRKIVALRFSMKHSQLLVLRMVSRVVAFQVRSHTTHHPGEPCLPPHLISGKECRPLDQHLIVLMSHVFSTLIGFDLT